MKYFKKIEGDRIYLSPMNIEDAETYVNWLCDYSVTDGIRMGHKLPDIESERKWIASDSDELRFAIVRKSDDKLLGNCSISKIDYLMRSATIGIFIGDEEDRSKGYGTETIKLLIDYGYEYLNLNNIMLEVFSFNERAIKCYKKAGFKEIGRRHECYYLRNKWYDEIYMEILRKDYYKGK